MAKDSAGARQTTKPGAACPSSGEKAAVDSSGCRDEDVGGRLSAQSRTCRTEAVQDNSAVQNASGNAAASSRANFPWPSFSRTATGRWSSAVLTTTSVKLSPFTSREASRNPPAGAVIPMDCPVPLLNSNRIQYFVDSFLLVANCTMARSGDRSPSKSAMANGKSAAAALLGAPARATPAQATCTHAPRTRRARRIRAETDFAKGRSLWIPNLILRICTLPGASSRSVPGRMK